MVDYKQIGLLVIVAILIIFPLAMYNGDTEAQGYFSGSDDQGGAQIQKMDPSYVIWAHPLWEPPSGEIESLLFALQAAIGAIIIGYLFGYWHGQNNERKLKNKKY